MGFIPSNAENIASVGGIFIIDGINDDGTPALDNPEANVCGSIDVSPKINIVKNIPILAVVPTFLMVVSMPDAEPLVSGGTDDITADVFGAVNIPMPAPNINNNTAISI